MHIAFLTPEYPHPITSPSGGLGTSIKNVAEELVAMNIDVSVLVYGQEREEKIQEEGVYIYLIQKKEYLFGGWYFYRKYLENRLNTFIAEQKVDLVEAPDWTGITAFINLKCPIVIRLNGSDAYFCYLEKRKQKFKNRFFEKKALSSADEIISVSEFTGNLTLKIFNLNRSYEVIPNSIQVDKFRAEKDFKPGRILYFGTLIRKKGIIELAEIFNKIVEKNPEAELVLAGRDVVDIKEKVSTFELFKRNLSSSAISRIKYLGSLPYESIKNEIEKANVIILPSFAEALPMTWIEAMAMKKALVTSNVGWANEVIINGESGYTVNPKDHKEFATKVSLILDDNMLCVDMGEKARKRVEENFSSTIVANRNIEFYNKVISRCHRLKN